MTTIFVRTVLFYILIVTGLRLTGKRQIGQLELSELVTALMLSELAAIPIANNNIPLMYGVVPMLILVAIEVIISFLSTKYNLIRKMVDGSPSTLIYRGVINQKEMTNSRITMNEMLVAVRTAGIPSIKEVDYIFLESNGTITVIPKRMRQTVTPQDLNLKVTDNGIDHALIIDGIISDNSLSLSSKTKEWLYKELNRRNLLLKDVFYFSINDLGDILIIEKERKK